MTEKVVPYKNSEAGKQEQVAQMFDSISHRYDLLNTILSFGVCIYWRKRLVNAVKPIEQKIILDVATGTADIAIALSKYNPVKVIGTDISEEMMSIGRKKVAQKKLGSIIELIKAPAERLPFDDNKFDIVTVAYGVRNFEHIEKGLDEILRVMKPGAKLAILEFSKPKKFPIKQIFTFYFRQILPLIGKWVAKDARAYTYLPESVQEFPEGESFLRILQSQGFVKTQCKELTFGIASLYTAFKSF
jgi:demethylmenaquinone methyltransferase / 2-methoxy-6-polyprenyl-1,4-benzoquinol methylase